MSITRMDNGAFLFQFFTNWTFKRVFNGEPWTFDNHLLILEVVQSGDIHAEIPLYHVNFWVQVHDLPAGFMTPIVGQHLGNFIGEFVEYVDNNNAGVWR